MRMSGGNKERHWHKWTPNDKDTSTTKTCDCGAIKRWCSTKWVVRKGSLSEAAVIRAGLSFTQSKILRGSSPDGRTNAWQLNCPKCGNQWRPSTTMLARREESCPRCGHTEYVDYNA